jgi:hypothetical protein
MRRACSRPGCAEPAVASLSYDTPARRAWIGDLLADEERAAADLCAVHAARFGVPVGWELLDERHEVSPPPDLTANSPMLARAFRAARAS